VLTALGFLVAGITLGLQKGKVMKRYRKEMEKGRHRLQLELTEELYRYIETLKTRMNDHFSKFDELLTQETEELSVLTHDLKLIGIDLENIHKSVTKAF
jgi:hypothetical protein